MENSLILNREFQLPADGYYQIAPLGEFPNTSAGVVQVIDRAACDAMASRFAEESAVANFGGVLVDFDHGSLDNAKSSEASGWVTALQVREGGLFANIRWSDTGEAAVKGGRYRYVSPVWARSDCEDLGGGRVRPMRLLNLAVTNDPNLKGMVPLSNRGLNAECGTRNGESKVEVGSPKSEFGIRNAAAAPGDGEKRFKWVLGNSKSGPCAGCAAVGGQVHTMGEWNGAGLVLPVHPNCACSLEETSEPSTGAVVGIQPRHDVVNAGAVVPAPRVVRNVGWTEQARAASLAVRQAKAAARGGAVPAPTKPGRTIHTPPYVPPLPGTHSPPKPLPKPGTGGTTTLPGPGGGPPIVIATPGPQPMPVIGSPEWLSKQMFLFHHVQFRAFLDSALTQLVLFLTQKQQSGQGLDAQETAFMSQVPAELARRHIVIKYPPVGIYGKPVPGTPPTKPVVRLDSTGHVPGSPRSANPGIQFAGGSPNFDEKTGKRKVPLGNRGASDAVKKAVFMALNDFRKQRFAAAAGVLKSPK